MRKLLLIGGGRHCASVLDCVLESGNYDETGVIDMPGTKTPLEGIPLIGCDDDLPGLYRDGWTDAFITVGSIGDNRLRHRLFEMVRTIGFSIPVIIAPSAVVARDVRIDKGTFIGHRAVINIGSRIGANAIINTGAVIEHDCIISDFVHVSPGSTLCGQVEIGSDTHIGAGSVVRQQIRIGSRTLIGAGSVVVKDIPDDCIAFGNPCEVHE